MGELYLQDYMSSEKMYSDITALMLKQISRGRFLVDDNSCKMKIIDGGMEFNVIVTNDVNLVAFKEAVYHIHTSEPSIDFFYNMISELDLGKSLVQGLKRYKEKYYKRGSEYGDIIAFKLYSKYKIEDSYRDFYHAEWIDYEEQLKDGEVIYDSQHVNGIFAMPPEMLISCLNEECLDRYGKNLFKLALLEDCYYLCDGKEIIGDRFRVVEKYDMESIDDIQQILRYLLGEMEKKSNRIIQELKDENRRISQRKSEETNNQFKLLYIIKIARMRSILLLVLGCIIGFVLSYFLL